ncbi:MAG: SpoIID/LytB domain-containing protein [Candidatus Marinimicrobia bacterium]|nr:SpoIID/LytB domain-containing protein [Candidatus Neomarinimicrobiota bacterium]MCF7905229.1 SpoIID/LytB domain-containing protein [Candidatus Neomarinimicrobiota bacterium]
MFRAISLLLLLFSLSSAITHFDSEPVVRVRVIHTLDTIKVRLDGNWNLQINEDMTLPFADSTLLQFIRFGSGMTLVNIPSLSGQEFRHFSLSSMEDSAQIIMSDVPFGVGWWWGGQEDRLYEGIIHIYPNTEHLSVTIHLPLEQYLKGVVPYEIGGTSPAEALKAQAVAARSEAVIALNSGLYGGDQHDLTSDVECQVFSGNHRRTEASDQAVDDTRGLVISEDDTVIHAFYASNCGGRSELIENVWSGRDRPATYQVSQADRKNWRGIKLNKNCLAKWWIRSSPNVYCNPSRQSSLPSWSQKNFRWSREFETEEISSMITNDDSLGKLKKIKILERGHSGRIIEAKFIFENGAFEKQGELAIRQLFSPSLRSSCFYVKKRGDTFTLHGAGWGHGVGMCQSGAIAQASNGISYDWILQHYYPAASILDIYGDALD